MANQNDEKILKLLEKHGEMHSDQIIANLPEVNESTLKGRLQKLKKRGKIDMLEKSLYVLASTSTQTRPDDTLKQISKVLRSAEDNEETISKLLNLYDDVLDRYKDWVVKNVGSHTDFEQQLAFIENFKWLTMIADKLMKRWSLVHVGYDTNTRQAQEDAKLKTEAKKQEALKDAPLEATVNEVGHFHTDLKELWDNLPESEKEKHTV